MDSDSHPEAKELALLGSSNGWFAKTLFAFSGITQHRLNMHSLYIRKICEDVLLTHAAGEILEHIRHRNPRANQTRLAPAHTWCAADQRDSWGGHGLE